MYCLHLWMSESELIWWACQGYLSIFILIVDFGVTGSHHMIYSGWWGCGVIKDCLSTKGIGIGFRISIVCSRKNGMPFPRMWYAIWSSTYVRKLGWTYSLYLIGEMLTEVNEWLLLLTPGIIRMFQNVPGTTNSFRFSRLFKERLTLMLNLLWTLAYSFVHENDRCISLTFNLW